MKHDTVDPPTGPTDCIYPWISIMFTGFPYSRRIECSHEAPECAGSRLAVSHKVLPRYEVGHYGNYAVRLTYAD